MLRRPPEPFPQLGQGLFERRTAHGPALRLELTRDGSLRIIDGCGSVERALDPGRQLGVVLAGASGEAFGLSTELFALETAPDEASTGGLLTGEHLTKETQRRGTLAPQELAEAPQLPATRVDPHVEKSDVEFERGVQMAMSQARARLIPAPTAAPSTAATVGIGAAPSAMNAPYMSSSGAFGDSRSSTEPPAENTGGALVRMIARQPAWVTSSTACVIAHTIAHDNVLR